MAKRALIFSFVYYPRFIGGAEIAVKEITDRIHQDTVEFEMITLRVDSDLPKVEKIGNILVHRIGIPGFLAVNKYLYPFLSALKGYHLYRKSPYDLAWAIMANYSGFGALFFKLFHMKVPFLLTLQEGDPIDYILKCVKPVAPIFKMIFTHADRIQAISKYLADFAKSMGAKCPVEVVPNGVDTTHFSQRFPARDLEELKRELGKAEGDVLLVTAGRLVVKNGTQDIIDSLLHLPENVKLLIIGSGYEEKMLKKRVASVGLDKRVIFLGFVDHESLPQYLQASDIFIRPSISEGFGNSFVEAMAAGVPVIATPVGGIVDFLKDKETGLFCQVNDPADIARKVEIYLHDAELRKEIIENAAHMVVDTYDWKQIAFDMRTKAFDILLS
jgi:glycosyltransferase involved in cell wall biosynthesis